MIQINAAFPDHVILAEHLALEEMKMNEGEILYLGLVIGAFVLFALVMGYVNLRQK